MLLLLRHDRSHLAEEGHAIPRGHDHIPDALPHQLGNLVLPLLFKLMPTIAQGSPHVVLAACDGTTIGQHHDGPLGYAPGHYAHEGGVLRHHHIGYPVVDVLRFRGGYEVGCLSTDGIE